MKKHIYELLNLPINNRSNKYFYNEGVVNVFIPYEVGSYVAGFVEVTLSTALWMNFITRA
ncbi:DUF3298 domain-containing protein [Paenibacillus polysaccharolyticus]|uniref:DUF3298 domain-containing protein n=1 Tax=Paenibacillus polysaccharolyticus TaxID=582692 RepID=UPI001113C6C9